MSRKQYYSDDERIIRVWDIETIKDLLSRRQVLNMNNERRKELDTLWVSEAKYRKTASFGSNWGYYVGMDEISNYYVVQHTDAQQRELDAKCALNPALRNHRDNFGYGDLYAQHISTPCVVLSGDGRTAKGVWYSLGVESKGNPDGSVTAMWKPARICADFVKEDSGEWKIWHLLISNDVEYEAGTNLGEIETFTGIPSEEQKRFGEPTVPYVVHNRDYGWSDDYPTVPPKAYYSFDPAQGYGVEGRPQWRKGHPNYRKEYQGK